VSWPAPKDKSAKIVKCSAVELPSKKMKKFYAIARGRCHPCVVTDWEECTNLTNGYSNCCFKAFKVLEEAEEWLGLQSVSIPTTRRWPIGAIRRQGKPAMNMFLSEVPDWVDEHTTAEPDNFLNFDASAPLKRPAAVALADDPDRARWRQLIADRKEDEELFTIEMELAHRFREEGKQVEQRALEDLALQVYNERLDSSPLVPVACPAVEEDSMPLVPVPCPAMEDKCVQVLMRGCVQCTLLVSPDWTGAELSEKIEIKEGVPRDWSRLVCKGTPLRADVEIGKVVSLQKADVIWVTVRGPVGGVKGVPWNPRVVKKEDKQKEDRPHPDRPPRAPGVGDLGDVKTVGARCHTKHCLRMIDPGTHGPFCCAPCRTWRGAHGHAANCSLNFKANPCGATSSGGLLHCARCLGIAASVDAWLWQSTVEHGGESDTVHLMWPANEAPNVPGEPQVMLRWLCEITDPPLPTAGVTPDPDGDSDSEDDSIAPTSS